MKIITTLILLAGIIFLDVVITGIDVLVVTIMLVLVAYSYKRHPAYDWIIYTGAVVAAGIALLFGLPYLESGLIGYGLINMVMFTGILPNQWKISRKLRTYRALYSIAGVILILPHAYINLFVDKEIDLFGVAALVIMLPLFITSFKLIRKEMKAEEWFKLQKASYLVYVLVFIHLLVVADWPGKVVYAIMMTLYVNNKLIKEFKK